MQRVLASLPRLRVRPSVIAWSLLALVPVVFIAMQVAAASRDIVYWDEFDTVLDLMLRLDAGVSWHGFWERIFAINNEHRIVTSRLLFAASWWLTGSVDFRIINVIGDLFLVALCLVLIAAADTTERRVRLGVVLAALMFQLGHFENLFWAGASIDHFQVVMLAAGAIVLLARGTGGALGGAAVLAVLATFTLVHGIVIWPVGAFLLWRERRWRALAIWAAIAMAAVLAFFHGFEVNSGHRLANFDAKGLVHIVRYWLALAGAPVALGSVKFAPCAGALLIAAAGALAWRGGWRTERVMTGVLLYCLGALALIAIGRSEVAGGQLQSRYMVLSALAWAAVIFTGIEHATHPARPFRMLAMCLPALAAFNFSSDRRFAHDVESFVEGRDGAVLRYLQYGTAGRDGFEMYPVPERANTLLKQAAARGIYWIPELCTRTEVKNPQPSARIQYFVDEMTADTRAIYISGWAAMPKHTSRRGEIYLVFRSAKNFLVYSTVAMSRPDVAAANENPAWRLSGFRLALTRWHLPPEEFQLGILFKDGKHSEFTMTEHRLRPYGRGEAILATGQ